MNLINNFDQLAITPERKKALEMVNAGFESIEPNQVMESSVKLENNVLTIKDKTFKLSDFHNVFLIGIGKGSAGISKILEDKLEERLSGGYVIDTNPEEFKLLDFTLGTHPLPSQENLEFTQKVVRQMRGLSEKDLVLVVICGGGSAMLVHPVAKVTLEEKINTNKALLKSGADIIEMNTVRKHLSLVKGGGLAKLLYPATIASLIFSDVPGNDLSFIASGPTVKDATSNSDALEIIKKYNLQDQLKTIIPRLAETPKDDKYFKNVHNILVLSNRTALEAMQKKAQELGLSPVIFSDKLQGYTKDVSEKLLEEVRKNKCILAAGESTVHVTGKGKGGRNQEVAAYALQNLQDENIILISFDSDGWDNSEAAGAIADKTTLEHMRSQGLEIKTFVENNNSYELFQKSGDAIMTNRLPSNVSDLMLAFIYD
jgi:glycerate-2-kinase